jgi:hypothetical protein
MMNSRMRRRKRRRWVEHVALMVETILVWNGLHCVHWQALVNTVKNFRVP